MFRLFPLWLALCWLAEAQSSVPFANAPEDASPRVAQLRKAIGTHDSGAVTSFWEEISKTGTPLVEPIPGQSEYSLVTFLWQAKGNTVNVAIIDGVAGGIGEFDPSKNLMTSIPGTDVWYRTYKVRNDAAFTYWISPNDSLERLGGSEPRSTRPQADPLNPRKSGPQSFLQLSAAHTEEAAVPKGRTETTKFTSALMKNERPLIVYTPPGYVAEGRVYPLLVMLDGGAFTSLVDTPAILDRLIAQKKIPPTVALFVAQSRPEDRGSDLTCNNVFTDFLAKEALPWVRSKYHAGNTAANTIIGGSSLGGLAALFAGFWHSETFGNVISLSGSNWWRPSNDPEPEWLARQLARSPAVPVHVSMSVGLMEVHDQLDTNRHLRDVLIAKGYALRYGEFNGNHGYLSWQVDLPQRLADVFALR